MHSGQRSFKGWLCVNQVPSYFLNQHWLIKDLTINFSEILIKKKHFRTCRLKKMHPFFLIHVSKNQNVNLKTWFTSSFVARLKLPLFVCNTPPVLHLLTSSRFSRCEDNWCRDWYRIYGSQHAHSISLWDGVTHANGQHLYPSGPMS